MKNVSEKARRTIDTGLARGLMDINRGIIRGDDIKKLDRDTSIQFEIFRSQLKDGTWDYEGVKKKFELYCALLKFQWEVREGSWKVVFYKKSDNDVWKLIRIGLYYMCYHKIKAMERDNPILAALYTPFCITYNCPYKEGCLFSIAEDILGLFDLILVDSVSQLKHSFEKEIISFPGIKDTLEDILSPVCQFLNDGNMLPTHISKKREQKKEDTYVTLRIASHILKNSIKYNPAKLPEKKKLKSVINKCCSKIKEICVNRKTTKDSLSSLAHYLFSKKRMFSVKDDSPAMELSIGRTLLDIYTTMGNNFIDKEIFENILTIMVTHACEVINNKELGPAYGKDRYSGIGWCTLSEIPTMIIAMDFLLDIRNTFGGNSSFLENKFDNIRRTIIKGVEYLVSCQREDYVWPIVNTDKLENFIPQRREEFWDGIKVYDERIIDKSDFFNISFSNTLDSIRVLIRAVNFLEKGVEK